MSQTSAVQNDGLNTQPKPQIVVSTLHRRLVEDALGRRFGIGATVADADDGLDLVLLDLDADQVMAVTGDLATSLGTVLAGLYAGFAAEYDGWVPTFGRNRTLRQVVSQHRIDGGAEGAPKPYVSLSPWPPRQASPGAGVQVAVADTAFAPRPQLVGSILAGADSLLPDPVAPLPSETGHGTFVTGLVLLGAPGATVHATRVLGDDGLSDSWDVAKAMVRLARRGVDVLNLSLGCFTDDGEPPLVLARALSRLGPDVVVVAAAGNHGDDHEEGEAPKPMWPAAFDSVLAVGATDSSGARPVWSPDPAACPWVDVQACGADVDSVYLEGKVVTALNEGKPGGPTIETFNGFARWSGTSFAAARVTGMIAAATEPGRRSASAALGGLLAAADQQDARPWLG